MPRYGRCGKQAGDPIVIEEPSAASPLVFANGDAIELSHMVEPHVDSREVLH